MSYLLPLYPGDHATWIFASVIVQVTILTTFAILLTRFPVRRSAATRSAICLCTLTCALLVPLMAYGLDAAGISFVRLPLFAMATPETKSTVTETAITENMLHEIVEPDDYAATPSALDSLNDPSKVPSADMLRQPAEAPSQPIDPSSSYSSGDRWHAVAGGLLLVWITGVAVCVVRLLRGCLVLKRLRREVRSIEDHAFSSVLKEVCAALDMKRLPRVVTSQRLAGPVVTDGPGGPMVILPEGMLRDLDDQQLRDVLTHECAHLVQRDILVGMLQRTAQIIFWPHLLVHRLNGELTNAREDLCDNFVLRRGDATSYARTLVEISQTLPETHVPIGACGMFDSAAHLETRIVNLLNEGRNLMTRTKRSTLVALSVVFLAVSALMSGSTLLKANDGKEASSPQLKDTAAQPGAVSKSDILDRYAGELRVVPRKVPLPERVMKVGENYIVLPITTGLQRLQRRDAPSDSVFVLINGPALIAAEGKHLDASALRAWEIEDAIRPFAAYGPSGVRFSIFNGTTLRRQQLAGAPLYFVRMSMQHIGKEAGFENVKCREQSESVNYDPNKKPAWKNLVDSLTVPPTADELQAEAGVGNDEVMLYPIRTPLSRYLNPDYDCVIYFISPHNQTAESRSSIVRTMKRSLPKLNLKKKHRVRFVLNLSKERTGVLMGDRLEGLADKRVWKELLGFESATWEYRN